jgi:hypothetical protein
MEEWIMERYGRATGVFRTLQLVACLHFVRSPLKSGANSTNFRQNIRIGEILAKETAVLFMFYQNFVLVNYFVCWENSTPVTIYC